MKWKTLETAIFTIAIGTLMLFWGSNVSTAGQEGETITVFAAASTTNAVSDIAKIYMKQYPGKVRLSFASSSTLAKQISHGAPSDIYISANKKWMDYLEREKMISKESRIDLLGNRLVLIAPVESRLRHMDIHPNFSLVGYLGDGRLAMGDPDHVPAGMYGKDALMRLNVWKTVEHRIAGMKDVRAALMMVERGEVPLGLVYATDAAISHKVRVVGVFSSDTHPAIVYPVAIVKGRGTPAVMRFMDFLQSASARSVFERYGFSVP